MDRSIVYPGSIPLDTDLLSVNRNVMVALGYLAQAVLGAGTALDGLVCTPSTPASMTIVVSPGIITQLGPLDAQAYGSLPADPVSPLLKIGVNSTWTQFTLTAPASAGQAVNYLVQAAFQESDTGPVVLPYYNAANPGQPFSGPGNAGTAQNTVRTQRVQLQVKAGAAANAGSQSLPPVDNGWVGLYAITVAAGQTAISAGNIALIPSAPLVGFKLPQLRPGFGSAVQTFYGSDVFVVPPAVTQVEVELWGGGSGSFASVPNGPSGGGAGGGYAKKRIGGLTPGQSIPVTVGTGGTAGPQGGYAGAGGSSSFGTYVSATGGSLNPLANPGSPQTGATPGGIGIGGDLNVTGSGGGSGLLTTGGMGGAASQGASQNSGTQGNPGLFPGGGASGAGTGSGSQGFGGGTGSNGFVIVRW